MRLPPSRALNPGSTGRTAGIPAKKDERSLVTILFQECLKDRNVWLFAITYFFVYVVRQARPGIRPKP